LYQHKLDKVKILTNITSSIQPKPYGSAHLRELGEDQRDF
jgi:hypothetical protein